MKARIIALFIVLNTFHSFAQGEAMAKAFEKCTNDTVFIRENSVEVLTTMDFDVMYKTAESPTYMHQLFALPPGAVVGPIPENNKQLYLKIIDADSTLSFHVAHIIVTHSMHPEGDAKTLIDEAFGKLKSGTPWTNVVDEYSEDGSVERDGDLDWSSQDMFVPSFAAACLQMKKGDQRIVETEYGWHIIWMKSAPKKTRNKVTCLRLVTK